MNTLKSFSEKVRNEQTFYLNFRNNDYVFTKVKKDKAELVYGAPVEKAFPVLVPVAVVTASTIYLTDNSLTKMFTGEYPFWVENLDDCREKLQKELNALIPVYIKKNVPVKKLDKGTINYVRKNVRHDAVFNMTTKEYYRYPEHYFTETVDVLCGTVTMEDVIEKFVKDRYEDIQYIHSMNELYIQTAADENLFSEAEKNIIKVLKDVCAYVQIRTANDAIIMTSDTALYDIVQKGKIKLKKQVTAEEIKEIISMDGEILFSI